MGLTRLFTRMWLLTSAFMLIFLAFSTVAFAAAAQAGSKAADPAVPDITDDLGSWAAIVGLALPPLVAVIQKVNSPSWANGLIFGVAVVVASIIYGFIRFGGDFTWAHWEGTFLAVIVWGVGTYRTFWHPPGKTDTVVSKIRANVGVR